MADFDGLIRQALASQNAADPEVRQRIYQSSRRALAKMLGKSGNVSEEAINQHFERLELSISGIEAAYAPPPEPEEQPGPQKPVTDFEMPGPALEPARPEPAAPSRMEPAAVAPPFSAATPVTPRSAPSTHQPVQNSQPAARPSMEPQPRPHPIPQSAPSQRMEPSMTQPSVRPAPQPTRQRSEPGFDEPAQTARMPENVEPYLGEIALGNDRGSSPEQQYPLENEDDFSADPPPTYRRKHPLLRRIWPIFLALAVIGVILWILYAMLANMPGENAANPNADIPGPVGQSEQGEDGSILITLLEPTDLSALSTAGRGSAQLITEQKSPILRIQSLRQGGLSETPADPILLELEKGVLQQVAGKEVTVEFLTKSGSSGPAQFAVECDIAGESVCGRKRFRVGLQPERIVFSLKVRQDLPSDAKAYLAINTDITNAANTSGEGDLIDIVYVRLRIAPQ